MQRITPMKRIFPFSLVAATLIAATAAAAPTTRRPGYVHPVGAVEHATGSTITVGTPSMEVLLTLGSPTRWLDGDTWVYAGFLGQGPRSDDGCHNLVVTVKAGRVVGLQLGCNRAIEVLAARLQSQTRAPTRLAQNAMSPTKNE